MNGRARGAVCAVHAASLEIVLPGARSGDTVLIRSLAGRTLRGRVTRLCGERAYVVAAGSADGIAAGDIVDCEPGGADAPVGTMLLGRAIDPAGEPLDGGPRPRAFRRPAERAAPGPTERRAVDAHLWTGIRAIDGLVAFGRGARIGIFGPPGAGKSTLLESIVRGAQADATVVALAGERGREVRAWIDSLDPRTALVCAAAERHPAERIAAAHVAFAQAEHLRERGLHVLLVLDSLARVASAERELALARGEAPGRGGYPASVFPKVHGLLERAGNFVHGSISLVATVLTDGGEPHDPLAEACRAALDGHIVLSEALSQSGRFPAIDVLASASRTMSAVSGSAQLVAASRVRRALAVLEDTRDARALGLAQGEPGGLLTRAVAAEPALRAFFEQDEAPVRSGRCLQHLAELADTL